MVGAEAALWTRGAGWRRVPSPLAGWPEGAENWLAAELGWPPPIWLEGSFALPADVLWFAVGAGGATADSAAAARWYGRWLAEAYRRSALQHNLDQALEDFRALAEIGSATTARLDLEHVLRNMIGTVGRILDVESGGCLLHDPDTNQILAWSSSSCGCSRCTPP